MHSSDFLATYLVYPLRSAQVIGCSVAGFEGRDGADPGVSVTLLQVSAMVHEHVSAMVHEHVSAKVVASRMPGMHGRA